MSKPTGKLIRLTANDVGAYTKAESDNKIADAKKAGTDAQTTANTANTNATNANNNANGWVPNTRKVNNKALSADITITAGDVGAYTKAESDTKIADAKKAGTDAQTAANAASTNATNANNNANGRVPNTRKVNNKPLSVDITITAGDVGALTQAVADMRYQPKGSAARYVMRLIGTYAGPDGAGTITLSESITGKWFACLNRIDSNVLTLPVLVPSDGILFGVDATGTKGSSGMRIKMSNGGKTLNFSDMWYFKPEKLYVWE
ncbi:hypothetical protein [Providencia stuartii]